MVWSGGGGNLNIVFQVIMATENKQQTCILYFTRILTVLDKACVRRA